MSAIINSGLSYIAGQQSQSQPVAITEFLLANISGLDPQTEVNPDEALPPADQQVWQGPVSQAGYLAENRVVYSLQLDSTIGDFEFNWMGLLADDGTLIAVSYLPAISKIRTDGNVQGNNLTRNFVMEFSDARTSTGINIDAATWQMNFNQRLKSIDQRAQQTAIEWFGRQCFFNDSFLLTWDGSNYHLTAGIGYVNGLRVAQSTTDNVAISASNATVYLDVALVGSGIDHTTIFSLVTGASLSDYQDSAGNWHYLEPIATIQNQGVITDNRNALNKPTSIVDLIRDLTSNVPAHDHDIDDVNGLQNTLDGMAALIQQLDQDLSTHHHNSDYAAINHTHNQYALSTHNHSEYAASNHSHSNYAASNHTHSQYAETNHTHSDLATSNHHHDERYVKPEDLPDFTFNQDLSENGYTELPNNVILQWGNALVPPEGFGGTFPIAFPNVCRSIVVSLGYLNIDNASVTLGAVSLENFPANFQISNSTAISHRANWYAIGY